MGYPSMNERRIDSEMQDLNETLAEKRNSRRVSKQKAACRSEIHTPSHGKSLIATSQCAEPVERYQSCFRTGGAFRGRRLNWEIFAGLPVASTFYVDEGQPI
jgi:hypothetical protein